MKFNKILISTLSVIAIIFAPLASTTLTMAAENQAIENDGTEVTPKQLSNGETVVVTKNEDKPYKEMDYNLDIVSKEDWENTNK